MKYIYTAVFSCNADRTKVHARIPDLPGCITTGYSIEDAIVQITDAASGWLVVAEDEGLSIPAATPQPELDRENADFVSFVCVDTIAYRSLTDTRAVRKNVSIPAWMATLADKNGINCSQLLQESLRERLSAL